MVRDQPGCRDLPHKTLGYDEVWERLLEAAEFTPLDRLGTTDDCGFFPFGDETPISRETAFAKIRTRMEGTAVAGREPGC